MCGCSSAATACASASNLPHEGGVPRDVLGEHLDGHVAADVGLDRPEDGSSGTVVDLLQESVAAERLAAEVESGVLFEDPLVESRELGRRVDAELVGQDLPRALIGAQRLGLTPVAVEGRHQQSPEALPEGVWASSVSSSPIAPVCARRARSPSIRSSCASSRSSSRRAASATSDPWSARSASAGPRHSARASSSVATATVGATGEGLLRVAHQRVEASSVEVERVEDQDVTGGTPLQQVLTEGPTKLET